MKALDEPTRRFVLDLMQGHNVLTLATVREDGWPQATTLGYANDGLALYVATFPQSQKVHNIRIDPRVSLTIDRDYEAWEEIKGLSMAAIAEIVDDPEESRHAMECLERKFPQFSEMPALDPSEVTVLKLTPKVISVLNYERGLGHTELVQVETG